MFKLYLYHSNIE